MRAPRRRHAFHVALVSCLAFACLAPSSPSFAQQKPAQSQAEQPSPTALNPTAPAPTPSPQSITTPTATNVAAPANATAIPARAASPVGDDQVIINADLITLNVTLTDSYGRYVTGLGKNAFTVFDDKEPQAITFFSDDDAPISLGVIFDVSGSMGRDKLSKAHEALRHFIETSHSGDEYFLIGFNSRAQLLLDRTRDSDALLDKLTFVQTHGQTALYDACYLGVEKVAHGVHPKRALLVISDGQDNSSRYTFNELRKVLKESDVLIYAIGINDKSDANSPLGNEGVAILDELASVSGGKAFFPETGAEMNEIFERIAIELRHQYSIGYRPSNFVNNSKWHRIKVKVMPPRGLPRLFVRSKEGYYAVTNPR